MSSSSCGTLTKNLRINDSGIKKDYENKLNEFINIINNQKDCEEIMWDETVAKYVQTINKMKSVLDNENIKENVSSGLIKNLDNFIERCKSAEFHIAFVGAIKAGKSTLINALLGKNLASTSVTPETAALTKFRASNSKDYVKLTFYTSYEWEQLWRSVHQSKADVFMEEYNKLNADSEKDKWLNKEVRTIEFDNDEDLKEEIEKWTSSKRATHYFVKEVEVGLKDFNLPEQVVFVDTPGLDDPVKYRSDITRTYIDRANAVLVCVKSDAMTGGELATIYSVFANTRYNPEKVYVIGTQLDALNRPEENWKQQRDEWMKHLKRKDCYGNLNLAEKNLIGVAAYVYNLVNDYDNLDEDTIDFELDPIAKKFRIRKIEENLDTLMNFSKINSLKLKLEEEIIIKHKNLLVEDLKQGYINNKEDLVNTFKLIKNNKHEILQVANADVVEIRKKREERFDLLKESEKEKQELEKLLKQIRIATTKRSEELYETIRRMGGN